MAKTGTIELDFSTVAKSLRNLHTDVVVGEFAKYIAQLASDKDLNTIQLLEEIAVQGRYEVEEKQRNKAHLKFTAARLSS